MMIIAASLPGAIWFWTTVFTVGFWAAVFNPLYILLTIPSSVVWYLWMTGRID
jgi:hypothetical protein